jgi:KDO2-lipid IV(A) lauroyltransferase
MVAAGRTVTLLPAGLTVNIGAAEARVVARVLPLRRRVLRENLSIAFGDAISRGERDRIAREAYVNLAMLAVESLYIGYARREWVDSRFVGIEGREHLDALLSAGKPHVIVSAHFGNWELGGAYFAHHRALLNLSKPLHNPLVQEEVAGARARHGLEILWTDQANLFMQMVRRVKEGRSVSILPDQDHRLEGEFVPFFGRPASTTLAPAVLATRLNAPLVPIFPLRLGPTRHRLVVLEPIQPVDDPALSRQEATVELMRRFHARLEDMIRLHPTQYFWFHRRWKTTPEAAAKRRRTLERRRQEGRTD